MCALELNEVAASIKIIVAIVSSLKLYNSFHIYIHSSFAILFCKGCLKSGGVVDVDDGNGEFAVWGSGQKVFGLIVEANETQLSEHIGYESFVH